MQKEYAGNCIICNAHGKKKGFDLPAITFNCLEGSPTICEKCIFRILTNRDLDWRKEIKSLIIVEKIMKIKLLCKNCGWEGLPYELKGNFTNKCPKCGKIRVKVDKN